MKRILVACEFSGRVRDAFRRRGFEAFSCDLYPSEGSNEFHYECDVRQVLNESWDALIAFPPCTYLANSGARWWPERQVEQEEALDFVSLLLQSNINHIALENPLGIISTKIRKPDQIIQPYWFGEYDIKSTCLWLKNLPLLENTGPSSCASRAWIDEYPSDRQKHRSRTYQGIADAMAQQWGDFLR